MSIIRTIHNKENPYVMLSKTSLWDSGLSLRAVGLWSRLMSRPDNWQFRTAELAKSCDINVQTVNAILNELVSKGYAYRHRTRYDNGQLGAWEVIVFEEKISEEEFNKLVPQTKKPRVVNPCCTNTSSFHSEEIGEGAPEKIEKKKKGGKPPEPPSQPSFSFKRVKMSQEEKIALQTSLGESRFQEYLERLDEYADINPKRFKQYACHAAVIRKWAREDSKKFFNPSQASGFLTQIADVIGSHPEIRIETDGLRFSTGMGGNSTLVSYKKSDFKQDILDRLQRMGIKYPANI